MKIGVADAAEPYYTVKSWSHHFPLIVALVTLAQGSYLLRGADLYPTILYSKNLRLLVERRRAKSSNFYHHFAREMGCSGA